MKIASFIVRDDGIVLQQIKWFFVGWVNIPT
jgi:hypothetical protein